MRKNPISKPEVEKIEYILEDIKNGKLILEHPLQRYSGQWSTEQKSNLIRRALHDGKFSPILICTQYDLHGCEVRYLIDGVQRITTFESYVNDTFAISKNTIDYEVSYDGVVYETKENKSGKFVLKRDRKKNLIPVLDAEGNIQRRTQTIDIRGLRYSELPPELQEKLNRYLVNVQLELECTDEDIQILILDYNNGTKMNDAQIGKNRLGVEFARIVIELSEHSFIKNKCGFTDDNRKKGVIDRSINEALMLVNFGTENWVSSHKDLCRKLSNWLEVEHTEKMREMFDDLDEFLGEDKAVQDYLSLKEFFVVMANYKHFLDSDYKKECYAMFLNDFVKELSYVKNIATGEVDDNGEDIYDCFRNVYMNGTKQKPVVEARLEKMNEMLDEYLAQNCEGMFTDEEDEAEMEEIENICLENEGEELAGFAMEFANDEMAIQSLMLSTDSPYANFELDTLKEMIEWYKIFGNKSMLDDCIFYKSFATTNGIDESDVNMPLYIYAVKYIMDGYDEIDIDEWFAQFNASIFADIDSNPNNIPTSNSTIMLKQSEIIKNLKEYSKERGE